MRKVALVLFWIACAVLVAHKVLMPFTWGWVDIVLLCLSALLIAAALLISRLLPKGSSSPSNSD